MLPGYDRRPDQECIYPICTLYTRIYTLSTAELQVSGRNGAGPLAQCILLNAWNPSRSQSRSDACLLRSKTRGIVRFRLQGRNHGVSGHKTGVLYDSPRTPGPLGTSFSRPARKQTRETPGQRVICFPRPGWKSRELYCPEEIRRAEPPFDPSDGRRFCPDRTASPQFDLSFAQGPKGHRLVSRTKNRK